MKRIFAAMAALCLMASGVTHADTLSKIKSSKKIAIAIDLGAAPFGSYDNDMREVGSDVDTAKLIAGGLGVDLQIVPVTSTNRIPFLLTGKVDAVISQFGITDERKKVVAYSLPYASVPVILAGPPDAAIKEWADLAGKSVVVTRGTNNDLDVTRNAPAGTNIVRYDDDATSMTAIISGQYDLFATSPALINTINTKNPALKLDRKFVIRDLPFGVGLRKQDTDLKESIDGIIRTNLSDGKLSAIYQTWHKETLPESVLAAKQP
ncbi:amino acid ABC transporter [Skermanella stibiiresistens SB22]|uniref:Amino acid ABC transporter n=1 Tax=Skermanella stibiiresistens SB22 TaxID=1385369 RepID=W9HAG0_9PROT|nr:transporter substrate-binding domain-containing protein [Skermanella stibiiresistens]EWY41672.1 amino acid ABC transporter [Skermanella stibiiresistens SB22]